MNDVTFSGNEDDIQTFRKKIDEWYVMTPDDVKYKTEKTWLGRLLINSGVAKYNDKGEIEFPDNNSVSCRAFMSEIIDTSKDLFNIHYDSAWSPMINLWKLLIDKLGLNIEITFISEEPGCELYVTNDPDYQNKYVVDYNTPKYEEYDYCDESELIKIYQEVLMTNNNDLSELTKMIDNYNQNNLDYYVSTHKFENATLNDVD